MTPINRNDVREANDEGARWASFLGVPFTPCEPVQGETSPSRVPEYGVNAVHGAIPTADEAFAIADEAIEIRMRKSVKADHPFVRREVPFDEGRALEPHEAALLAAIVRSPSTDSPSVSPARARARRNLVLRLMRAQERITAAQLESARRKLYAAREQRVRPGRDEKILTSWNGLMIQAMAHAGAKVTAVSPCISQDSASTGSSSSLSL